MYYLLICILALSISSISPANSQREQQAKPKELVIDLAQCKTETRLFSWAFGSERFVVKGLSNDACIVEYTKEVEGAYKKSEALLSRYKRPDGSLGIDGIFTPNESTTLAMLRVLEDNGWAGKVKFVGFDASDTLVAGLRSGHIDALVLQDPVNMGYLGVKTMAAHLRGETVAERVDTGVRLVTRERMDDPDAKELLHPDLARWLKP